MAHTKVMPQSRRTPGLERLQIVCTGIPTIEGQKVEVQPPASDLPYQDTGQLVLGAKFAPGLLQVGTAFLMPKGKCHRDFDIAIRPAKHHHPQTPDILLFDVVVVPVGGKHLLGVGLGNDHIIQDQPAGAHTTTVKGHLKTAQHQKEAELLPAIQKPG